MPGPEPVVIQASGLSSDEKILGWWEVSNGWDRLVLTNKRIIHLHCKHSWSGKVESCTVELSRTLESISEPKHERDDLSVAGMALKVENGQAKAAMEEIAYARSSRLALLGKEMPSRSNSSTPTPFQREVITKEVVRIRCRYCGTLSNQTLEKCPSCGAKL